MSTVKELAVARIEKTSKALLAAAEKLSPEQGVWKPMDKGRTALSQVFECGFINNNIAETLNARDYPASSIPELMQAMQKAEQEHDTLEKAIVYLKTSSVFLFAAADNFPEKHLFEEVKLPFGMFTYEALLFQAYWNMSYHEGQINYILQLCAE